MHGLRSVAVLGVVMCVLLLPLLPGDATVQDLAMDTNYILVSSQRVSRTLFDFTYRAKMTNAGTTDMTGVSATLTSHSLNTVVMQGTLTFGAVPAGHAVTSSNTFTIRQDRTVAIRPQELVWQITGTPTPPPNPPRGQCRTRSNRAGGDAGAPRRAHVQ